MIVKLACDSDDVKPVNGVATGSTCLEVDTGDLYIFSEDNKTWNFLKNVGSEGGGGGDSDFSVAEVTIISAVEIATDFPLIAAIEENELTEESPACISFYITPIREGSHIYKVPLYKGACFICLDITDTTLIQSYSGNITPQSGAAIITGDCSITLNT